MDDSSLKALFKKIYSDDSLRRTLMEAIQHPDTSREANPATDPTDQEQQPGDDVNVSREAHKPRTENALLVAHEHQSRGVNGREAHVHPLTVNPPCPPVPAEEGLMEYDLLPQEGLMDSSVAFDPSSVAPNDDFVFDTHEVIINYLEKHFRSSLDKDVRNAMHKNTPSSTNNGDEGAKSRSLPDGSPQASVSKVT